MMLPFIDNNQISQLLSFQPLIARLKDAFRDKYSGPDRIKLNYDGFEGQNENTLLFMPAWKPKENLGVKLITVTPGNQETPIPSVQGVYILFDSITGSPKMMLDAKKLTTMRTAATSALASSFLSRKDSKTLLMVGNGALCKDMIKAHAFVRPIEKILLWGRNFQKSQVIASDISSNNVIPIENLEMGIDAADIISCATMCSEPLIRGNFLKAGQHIDLVGAYLPDSREADDEVLRKASIYIDVPHTKVESGEIKIPLENEIINESDIIDDLFGLSSQGSFSRKSDEEITLFKSTGHALEDLVAAQLVYEKYQDGKI